VTISTPEPGEEDLLRCLACGQRLEVPLSRAGSLRCGDCRDGNVPLDPQLVEDREQQGSQP
jgi:hypothetical protein